MSVKYSCDSCGDDCLDEAYLITVQEMAHPMRSPKQGKDDCLTETPGGIMPRDGKKQFMLCQDCYAKSGLPNPFGKDCRIRSAIQCSTK